MKSTKKHGVYLRRPTKVTVLNQDFRIEWLATGDTMGCVDLNACVIQVVRAYPKRTVAATLLHELIHAINHVMGTTDETSEEVVTRNLETGLSTVWIHNPKVFEWIHKQFIT